MDHRFLLLLSGKTHALSKTKDVPSRSWREGKMISRAIGWVQMVDMNANRVWINKGGTRIDNSFCFLLGCAIFGKQKVNEMLACSL